MKDKLKFFIQNSKEDREVIQEVLGLLLEEKGIEALVKSSDERGVKNLPNGYNGYLIEFSDVEKEAVEKLREKQPLSKIYGLGMSRDNVEYHKLFDKAYYIVGVSDLVDIIDESKEASFKK